MNHKTKYPFQSHFYDIHGRKMHYIDEGHGEIILFVPGTSSWSFDFWKVIKPLSKHYRCMAVDHMGFGLSDKPDNEYSAKNHSEALEQFILHLGLSEITLVVHDLGGPIGLYVAMRQGRRIKRIIVLNSWLWNCATDPAFKKIDRILNNPFQFFMYRYLNYPSNAMVHSPEKRKTPGTMAVPFLARGKKTEKRLTAIREAKTLLKDQEWYEELWVNRIKISEKPVLFIWGAKDRFMTSDHLNKFISGFENNLVHVIKSSGHSPHEDAPLQVAVSIWTWMSQHHLMQKTS